MAGKTRRCEVCGVKENQRNGFFARFPKDEVRCKTWVKQVGNADLVFVPIEKLHEQRHVCGNHFEKRDFGKTGKRLKKRAYPKLHLSAPPLSAEQMIEFPQHVASKQVLAANQNIPAEPLPVGLAPIETTASTSRQPLATLMPQNKNEPTTAIRPRLEYEFLGSTGGPITEPQKTVHACQKAVLAANQNIPAEPLPVGLAPIETAASTSRQPLATLMPQNKNEPTTAIRPRLEYEFLGSTGGPITEPQKTVHACQKAEQIPDAIASTSGSALPSRNDHRKDGGSMHKVVVSSTSSTTPVDRELEPKCNKRKLDNTDMSPRKKKLVEQLKRTRCTLASLRKSATLVDKIESPILKEIVLSASKNQARKPTGRRWTTKNKISCLAILKRSAKTYRYLRHIIPLPSIKTLQNVLKKIPMEPGINKSVLNHLFVSGQEKNQKEKVCALLFDEIALKPRLLYNPAAGQVDGFQDLGATQEDGRSDAVADHALVFMLQGIYKKFKQPIAFYFVKGTITAEKLTALIKEIICAVNETGYRILTTVCDQGPTNMGAIKLLKKFSSPSSGAMDSRNSFFLNDQEVFMLYDVPHLFKSIRNNFLKNGTLILNGRTAKWPHLNMVEEKNRNFLYFSKITQTHVSPKYRSKMKVKYAAQMLSNTVAAVLKLMSQGEKNESLAAELMETAQVVQELDRLFDCTNGPSCKEDVKKGLRQNVSDSTKHLEEWAKYEKKLETMKFINNAGTVAGNIKCVNGYVNSLKSLRGIWLEVKKIGFKYLNLRQVNQDSLENLFGVIRQHCPTNNNPTCAHFMSALKTAVVTGLTAPHSRGSNCQKDSNILLTNFHNLVFNQCNEADDVEAESNEKHVINADSDEEDNIPVLSLPENEFQLEDDLADIDNQPIVYVSGYVASRIAKIHKCQTCQDCLTVVDPEKITDPTYNYISLREWWGNKKSLTYPSKNLCSLIKCATDTMETEICPVLHRRNIFDLAVTLLSTNCDTTWFDCVPHKTTVCEKIFTSLAHLFIRRQCDRLNQKIAAREEGLADAVKRAQQHGNQ